MDKELLKQLCLDVDMDEAAKKGLVTNNELNDNYFKIMSLYKNILDKYLYEKLNLKKYDDIIKNNGLNIVPNDEEDYDVYQYTSNMGMKYLYFRNNLFIERLPKEQIDLLLKCCNDVNISDDIVSLVKNTYCFVIKYYKDKPDNINVNYGPFNPNYFAPNNSIVIGINANFFIETDLDDDDADDLYFDQMCAIYDVIEKMDKDFLDKLQCPVTVIRYDETSVTKINESIEDKHK